MGTNAFTYLKTLNLSGCLKCTTPLTFNGTCLETLNISQSSISKLSLINNLALTEINISGCTNLQELTIENCGLKILDASDLPYLNKLHIKDCANLETIILNHNYALNQLILLLLQ